MNELWTNYLFPFLTLFGFILLFYTVKNLLPSYFSEKGKNLATKEDISEVTKLVESAKHTFTVETERLKAQLVLLNSVTHSLVSEERNSIVDFNEKYFKWLNLLMDTSMNNSDDSQAQELHDYRRLLSKTYQELINSEARFTLFVKNDELYESLQKLKIETLQRLPKLVNEYIYSHLQINLDVEQNNLLPSSNEKTEQYKILLKKKRDELESYTDKLMEQYTIIAPLTHDFQEKCREYLYNLLNKD